MKLYLVRHGEIESNVKNIYPEDSETLSEHGKKQARILSLRFATIPLDAAITSPIQRALETATAISSVKKINLEQTDLLREKFWGKEFILKQYNDPSLLAVKKILLEKELEDPEYRHADEERFIDTRKRAQDFLRLVEQRSSANQNLLAVSHSHFLKVLLSVILHGQDVTAKMFRDVYNKLSLHNTGITVVEYKEEKWHILTLNDHAHLGEYHRQPH